MRLAKEFFNQDAVTLARCLIGKGLVREIDGEKNVSVQQVF